MTLSLENRNNSSQSSTINTVRFPLISRQKYLPPLLLADPSLATHQPADEVAAVARRTPRSPGAETSKKVGPLFCEEKTSGGGPEAAPDPGGGSVSDDWNWLAPLLHYWE